MKKMKKRPFKGGTKSFVIAAIIFVDSCSNDASD